MKRLFLLTLILFFSVLSTACVNNLAVQELNNKAQEFMQKGDTASAICRLEASLDLDNNIFETRYNLGIAYLTAEEYEKAIEMLNKALELNPDYVDIYYSLAVATDEINYQIIQDIKEPKLDNDKKDTVTEDDTIVPQTYKKLTDDDKIKITEKVNESIEAYNLYLEKKPDAEEKESIQNRITSLNAMLDFDAVVQ